jgi:hypothetical protein
MYVIELVVVGWLGVDHLLYLTTIAMHLYHAKYGMYLSSEQELLLKIKKS